MVDGRPEQEVRAVEDFPLEVVEVEAGEEELGRRVTEEVGRGFDLTRGPLVRGLLFRLGEKSHVLCLTVHHMVFDGVSVKVLLRELGELYETNAAGRMSSLPELSIQYADYAEWQRESMSGGAVEGQLEYWRRQLMDMPAFVDLPVDRSRPEVPSNRGGRCSFEVAPEVLRGLMTLGREAKTTLFMTLLAAFKVLLYRYTGQADVFVGTPTAGRGDPDLEPLIGFFVNTLVLRSSLSGNPTFRELLARVRAMALDAYEHENLPFEMLVRALRPRREMSRQPLFQIMFQMQVQERTVWRWGEVEVEEYPVELNLAKFDLLVNMVDVGGCLRGTINYAVDLFDGPRVGRMAEHLTRVLSEVAADPEVRILDVPIMGEEDRIELPEIEARRLQHAEVAEAPGLGRPEWEVPYAAPRTATERALAGIWARVLGIDRVGVLDNFFDLGGHSLTIPPLREAVESNCGVEVSVIDFLQFPTVAAFAEYLDTRMDRDRAL